VAAYDGRVNAAVLLPVKAFGAAKARLASALTSAERQTLVRWTTARVLDAASEELADAADEGDSEGESASAGGV
jgi:hypothetical protein